MEACRDAYGSVFTLRFTGLGVSQRIVFVSEPEGIRAVFGADPDQLQAGSANVALGALLGENSVLLLDGREHLRQRKLLLPPFHGERMQRYGELIADITNSEMERWKVGTPFALRPAMQRITLDVILRAVFGLERGDKLDELRPMVRDLVDITRNRMAVIPWF